MNPLESGRRWEEAAASFLESRGLKTVTRNYRCRLGEIDLVMRDGPCLVFTEVRYRDSAGHGSGAESVGPAKQKRLIRAALRYLQQHAGRVLPPCRFDVISVGRVRGELAFDWIRDAFSAD